MNEPMHASRGDAIYWVQTHTSHPIFTDFDTKTTIRVDANTETLLMLKSTNDQYYWAPLREI